MSARLVGLILIKDRISSKYYLNQQTETAISRWDFKIIKIQHDTSTFQLPRKEINGLAKKLEISPRKIPTPEGDVTATVYLFPERIYWTRYKGKIFLGGKLVRYHACRMEERIGWGLLLLVVDGFSLALWRETWKDENRRSSWDR